MNYNPYRLIPGRARLAAYLVYALGIPVLHYTRAKGWTGQDEQDLWMGLGVATGIVAASNITDDRAEDL